MNYYIGENQPWRLTKESGFRFALALASTQSTVIASDIDRLLPKRYASFRFSIPPGSRTEFERILGCPVVRIPEATGQSTP